MTKHQRLTAGDLNKPAIGDRKLRVRGRFRADDQFRILVRILRVAMMVPVKQAIILVRRCAIVKADRWPTTRFSARLRNAVLWAVSCIGHEQEGHQIGLHDDQRQGPRQAVIRGDQPYQRPDDGNCAVMTDSANAPRRSDRSESSRSIAGLSGFSRSFGSTDVTMFMVANASLDGFCFSTFQQRRYLGVDEARSAG